jgi:hypothetical protein
MEPSGAGPSGLILGASLKHLTRVDDGGSALIHLDRTDN